MGVIISFIKYSFWKIRNRSIIEKNYLEIDDIKLYYETYGNPKDNPLLLLHGGTAFLQSFAAQIPYFSKNKNIYVIAIDSRGHGRSTDSLKPLSYGLLAEDIKTLIEKLKLNQVNIIGWSDGGIIALHLAINYPELLNKIILVGTNYQKTGLTDDLMKDLKIPGGKDWVDFGASFMYNRLNPNPDPEVFFEKVRLMWLNEPNYTDAQISKIRIPTLLLAGENEQYIKREHINKMASLIPNNKLEIIKGTKHECIIEKPKIANEIMYNFLTSSFKTTNESD